MKPIVIIGGGITGLAAAYRLEQLRPETAVVLCESRSHLGGKLVSERLGNLLIEGGADSFLSRKQGGVALCEELGIAHRLTGRRPENRRTYVRLDGTLHRLPEGLSGFVPTDLAALENSSLLSAAGRARLAREVDVPPAAGAADESLAAFVTRRFGQEAYERLMEPLMSGIYAGDGRLLSLAATFPHLKQIEQSQGSLLRGLPAPAAGKAAYPPFVTLPGGVGELIAALVRRLRRTTILTEKAVTEIRRAGGGWRVLLAPGEVIEAQAVIVAAPAFAAAELLARLDAPLAGALEEIPYASSATISLAYRRADIQAPLDGYGYLIPRSSGSDLLACTWTSQKWAGRAPAGIVLLRVYAGRFGRRPILDEDDATLLELARGELADTLDIQSPPVLSRIYRWKRGMPQYNLGHLERLAAIERRIEGLPGLFLAGAAYRGVGIPDCIHSGDRAARAAAAACGEPDARLIKIH